MHIILHALFVQCIIIISINYQRSKLGDRSKTQHSTYAKTEQFTTRAPIQ